MDELEAAERLQLPPAPRSLWDFVGVLAPVLKYYAALLALFLGARWFNRQLDAEAAAHETQRERPKLSPELTVESSEEEEDEEEEDEMEELVTDGDRLVPVADKQRRKKKPNPTKELFDGLRKVEQELCDKKNKEDAEDNVSWNELHASMLRRYKDKYPEHGPRVADPETDRYDEEFNELLRKNNIDPEELKSQSAKKTE
ncbi:unnamed protein product [Phytophthora fragariaefolia]|uniref:Unnamed protein product n=1 Tax=Phytophthora fragariaefolia TaxID=1490495 RepID=A0A9W6XVS9_9STRA|nr:unnamed protein product [Phytophthora fragariaefolia]